MIDPQDHLTLPLPLPMRAEDATWLRAEWAMVCSQHPSMTFPQFVALFLRIAIEAVQRARDDASC